jgi:hypothetical protein
VFSKQFWVTHPCFFVLVFSLFGSGFPFFSDENLEPRENYLISGENKYFFSYPLFLPVTPVTVTSFYRRRASSVEVGVLPADGCNQPRCRISIGMEEAISCGVCTEPYDGANRLPRALPCLHTYCTACLSHLVREEKVVCPTCRRVCVVEGGQATTILCNFGLLEAALAWSLRSSEVMCDVCEEARAAFHCRQCSEAMCSGCQMTHKKQKATRSHQISTLEEFQQQGKHQICVVFA